MFLYVILAQFKNLEPLRTWSISIKLLMLIYFYILEANGSLKDSKDSQDSGSFSFEYFSVRFSRTNEFSGI